MSVPTQTKSKPKRTPNKVDVLKAVDRMPTKQNATGQGGQPGMTPGPGGAPPMAPPPFPYPSSQLDRSAPGVPNMTDMFLHSFRPTPQPGQNAMGAPPGIQPQAQAPGQGQQSLGGAPPMAARGQGARPQRRMG